MPWASRGARSSGPASTSTRSAETANEDQSPPRRYEFPLRRQDGRLIPVGISFWSLRAGDGEVAGLVGVCQDLSAIKQMEQRMRQADRLATVGRLSANMAHEIRNPLASISGAVEALAEDLPPDEGRNRLVEIVLRSRSGSTTSSERSSNTRAPPRSPPSTSTSPRSSTRSCS